MPKAFFLLFTISMVVCSCGNEREINSLSVKGIVISKFEEEIGCFGAIIFQNNNKFDTLKGLCYCVVEDQSVWKYVLPKDSIIKLPNTLTISIVRNGMRKNFVYPSCIQ